MALSQRDMMFVLKAKDLASKTFQGVGTAIRNTGNAAEKFSNQNTKAGAVSAGLANHIFKVRGALVTLGLSYIGTSAAAASGIAAYVEYEQKLINVAKTTGFTTEETNRFGKAIQDLSQRIPYTTTQLADIAEIAGQLGIVGADKITKFTEAIGEFTSAAPSLSAPEAAEGLARLATLTKEPIENINNISSAVVALGNELNGSEKDILAVSQYVNQSSQIFGLNAKQVIALSGTYANFGVRAELTGSNLQRVFSEMQGALSEGGNEAKIFAKVAGVSVKTLQDTFKKSTFEGFNLFVAGLSKLDKESQNNIFKAIKLDGVGASAVLGTLANNYESYQKTIATTEREYQKGTAATIEAQKAYASLANQIQITKNNFTLIQQELGRGFSSATASFLTGLTDQLRMLADYMQDNPEKVKAFAESILQLGKAVAIAITAFAAFKATVMTISFLGMAVGVIKTIGAFISLASTVRTVAGAVALMNAAFLLNPIGLIAAAVVGLIGAFFYFRKELQPAIDAVKEFALKSVEVIGSMVDSIIGFFKGMYAANVSVYADMVLIAIRTALQIKAAFSDKEFSEDDVKNFVGTNFYELAGKDSAQAFKDAYEAQMKNGVRLTIDQATLARQVQNSLDEYDRYAKEDARNTVEERPPITGAGGGGAGGSLTIDDEKSAKKYEQLLEQRRKNIISIQNEAAANMILLSGQTKSAEIARLMVERTKAKTQAERDLIDQQIIGQRELDKTNVKLEQRNQVTEEFSRIGENAFSALIDGSKSFNEILGESIKAVADLIFQMAVLAPLKKSIEESGFASSFASIFSAKGNVFSGGSQVQAFAKGGITNGPSVFNMTGNRKGVMGEAGTEGIFPLTRTANGDLGVKAVGVGGGGNINMPLTVVVQMQGNQQAGNSQGNTKQVADQIAAAVKEQVYIVIKKEKAQGGLLSRSGV